MAAITGIDIYEGEAEGIARYLFNRKPTGKEKQLYHDAVKTICTNFAEKERRWWLRCLQSRLLMGLTDAGLSTKQPFHPIRHRIFIMMAIAEVQPQNYNRFMPVARSPFYLLHLFYMGIKAILRRVIGRILVWQL